MANFERTLILDSSGRVGQVALASGNAVIAQAKLAEQKLRASDLTQVIAEVLSAQGWKARSVTCCVIGLGPGSYTGLRVGLAAAKTLCYVNGADFFGLDTYAAIAYGVNAQGPIDVIGDALNQQIFQRTYRHEAGQLIALNALSIVSSDEWRTGLAPGSVVAGAGSEIVRKKAWDLPLAPGDTSRPSPEAMLAVAQGCPWASERDVWLAEPYYLRGSSAEEKLKQRAAELK